jgi:hypothetical protein
MSCAVARGQRGGGGSGWGEQLDFERRVRLYRRIATIDAAARLCGGHFSPNVIPGILREEFGLLPGRTPGSRSATLLKGCRCVKQSCNNSRPACTARRMAATQATCQIVFDREKQKDGWRKQTESAVLHLTLRLTGSIRRRLGKPVRWAEKSRCRSRTMRLCQAICPKPVVSATTVTTRCEETRVQRADSRGVAIWPWAAWGKSALATGSPHAD